MTPAEALAEFLAPKAQEPEEPLLPHELGIEYVPTPITDAMLRREDVFWLLVERRGAEEGRDIYVDEGDGPAPPPASPPSARTAFGTVCLSLLHLGGMPWARIGEMVGHGDVVTTARTYTHVVASEDELDHAALLA